MILSHQELMLSLTTAAECASNEPAGFMFSLFHFLIMSILLYYLLFCVVLLFVLFFLLYMYCLYSYLGICKWDTLLQEVTAIFLYVSLLNSGQLVKERSCSASVTFTGEEN